MAIVFVEFARPWLKFLGRWREEHERIPGAEHLERYVAWMRNERGLSPATVDVRRRRIAHFLRWCGRSGRDLATLREINRGHWVIENRCHYVIDWNFDEDRSRIRSGHGPENVSRLRRFAVSLILCKPGRKVAETLRRLNRNVRTVFDYLLMSENARRTPGPPPAAPVAPPAPV